MKPTPEMIEAAAEMIMAYDSGTPFEWEDAPEHVKLAYKSRAADVLQAALAALWSDDMESAPKGAVGILGWYGDYAATVYFEDHADEWRSPWRNGYFTVAAPDYWMPLPQPPEAP